MPETMSFSDVEYFSYVAYVCDVVEISPFHN